jgi:hypothetical protein
MNQIQLLHMGLPASRETQREWHTDLVQRLTIGSINQALQNGTDIVIPDPGVVSRQVGLLYQQTVVAHYLQVTRDCQNTKCTLDVLHNDTI